MAAVKLNVFGGMIPAIDTRLLPDPNATTSRDTWLYNGFLSGFKQPVYIRDLVNPAAERVYRIPLDPYEKTNFNNSTWMEFEDPTVDVVRGPINDDAYSRYYWTGEDTDPLYNSLARIQSGDPPLLMGVPAPAAAPTITAPETPPDTVAPVADSATANASQIVITFTEERLLKATAIPPGSAFTVSATGVVYQVQQCYVSAYGLTVTLQLVNPLPANVDVTVSYSPPSSDVAIQDNSDNLCAAFSLSITGVANETVDKAGPVFGWADSIASYVWVSFVDESDMDETQIPPPSAWFVNVNGIARTVDAVSVVTGKKAYGLLLNSPVYPKDAIRVSYVKPSTNYVRDEYGNAAPSFSGQVVNNRTTAADVPIGPVPTGASTINTNEVQITFDKALASTTSWTLANVQARFTLYKNGVSMPLTSANRPTSTSITLQTSGVIEYGDVVTVSYAVPASSPYLQDIEGHQSAAFTNFRVVNNVTFVDTYSP
jgi:uncharacterized repeat protein (TIGR02059 family)